MCEISEANIFLNANSHCSSANMGEMSNIVLIPADTISTATTPTTATTTTTTGVSYEIKRDSGPRLGHLSLVVTH